MGTRDCKIALDVFRRQGGNNMSDFQDELSRLERDSIDFATQERLRVIEDRLAFVEVSLLGLGNRVNKNFDDMSEQFANDRARMDSLQSQINILFSRSPSQ
jgi:hypothetical protein